LTPELWAQIEELFHRAAECDPKQRASLLDATCKDDGELRRVVEGLLASEESARDDMQAAVHSGLDGVCLANGYFAGYRECNTCYMNEGGAIDGCKFPR
jgi:hypothetical protein